ncbi:MAG: hypothetical protein ACKVQR_10400 [Aquabacterium sp.]
MHRFLSLPAAAAALFVSLGAQAGSITVTDMRAAEWTQTVLRHNGNASVSFNIVGRPGISLNTMWETQFSVPASSGANATSDVVSNMFNAASWNPATDGAVDRLNFAVDALRVFSSFGSREAGFLQPAVEQNGSIFAVPGISLSTAGLSLFSLLAWQVEDTDAWTRASGTGTLDFSASGGRLNFGYLWGLGTTCTINTGCRAADSVLGVDNFRVTITPQAVIPPGTVPEPGGVALLLGAAAAAAAAGRGRRRAR